MKQQIRTIVLVAAACLMLARGAPAQQPDPAQVIPADALLYVDVTGADLAEALGGFALPPVARMAAPRLQSRFGHVEEALDLPSGVVADAVPHIRAAALAMLGRTPMLVLGFDNPSAAENIVARGTENPDGTVSFGKATVTRRGPFLVVADAQTATFVARGDYARLSDSAQFADLVRVEQERPAWARLATAAGLRRREPAEGAEGGLVRAYLAMPALLELLNASAPATRMGKINMLLAVSGLADVRTVTCSTAGAEEGPAAEVTLHLGEKARGLLALLPARGLRAGRWVPQDAAAVLALNWGDAERFFGSLRSLLVEVNNKSGDGAATRHIEAVEQSWGVTLDDLFGQIGSGAALYLPSAPEGGFIGRGDVTFVLALDDPQAFQRSLDSILTTMMGSATVEVDSEGSAVRRMGALPVHYSVRGNLLVAAGSRVALKRHVAWAAAPRSTPLAARVTDHAAMLRLDVGYLLQSYPQTKSGPKVTFTVSRAGDEVRMACRTQDWEMRDVQRSYLAAWAGIMSARIMPALRGARSAGSKAASRAHLQQIGLGMAVYKADHDGRFPLNLEVLLRGEYLADAEVFVDPHDRAPRRRGAMGLPYSYEYAGPVPKSAPAELIIAYARKDIEPGGRNVLYVDNVVGWVSEAELHTSGGGRGMSLRECYEWVMENSERLSNSRQRELRRFYEAG